MTFDAADALRALGGRETAGRTSPLRDAAFGTVRALTAQALPKGAETVVAAVEDARAAAEALWNQVRATPAYALAARPAPCAKGCGWCCHQRVGATVTEVFNVVGHLRRRPDAAPLIERLRAWNGGRPCVFLVNDACAIYEERPFKCRGVVQLDVRWCMSTFAKIEAPLFGSPPDPTFRREPKDIFDGAVFGLAHPLHMAGRDCPGVDFVPALKAVIDRPDALAAWWRGEDVFPAEARLHDWFPPVRGKTPPTRSGGGRHGRRT